MKKKRIRRPAMSRIMPLLAIDKRFRGAFAFILFVLCLGNHDQGLAASDKPFIFEDVTESAGLAPYLEHWLKGHAAAWGDVSGNGYDDLFVGAFADRPVFGAEEAPLPNMLFLNQSGVFSLAPDKSVRFEGERSRASMALFVDLDNRDRLDLLVGTHLSGGGGATRLFRNRFPSPFEDVTPELPRPIHMRNATAIDLEHNGLLDLLFFDGEYRGEDQGVVLLRNQGDFVFDNVPAGKYGLPEKHARALGVAVGDVNNNGRLDIFIAECNRLFVSDDQGIYHEFQTGIFPPFGRWPGDGVCGAAFADMTGNGLLDLVITSHTVPAALYLYVNQGIDDQGMPVLKDATVAAGLNVDFPADKAKGIRGAHLALVDLDNNGRRDILTAMLFRNTQGQLQPFVFRNTGVVDGIPRFSAPSPEKLVGYYATAPVADFDHDGRMDIFMARWHEDRQSHLFRNVTESGNYLQVKVRGESEDLNRMGIGATIRLYQPGRVGDPDALLGRADITLGNGYSCGEPASGHFGLADHTACDIEIIWQGRRLRKTWVQANQTLVVPMGGPMEKHFSDWADWVGPTQIDDYELPERGMRWNLHVPRYDGSPLTPDWATETMPEWLKPHRGKNGMPHWERTYQRPGSTCGDNVAGMDLYHANFFIPFRPETAAYLYRDYTPADAGYRQGMLPAFEDVVEKYTDPSMTDTEKLLVLLKQALPEILPHPGTPPYGPRTRGDRGLEDEELLASGTAYCNEQARVLIRLCQVLGMQGRLVHLFRQNHSTAEILVDGQWVLVDVSWYFVSRDENGYMLSAAASHDRGPGQEGWARSRAARMLEIADMTAEQAGMEKDAWIARQAGFRQQGTQDAIRELATRNNTWFGVMNYPLPKVDNNEN